MLCDLLNCELRVVCRGLLVFLDRSFSSAMGCFLACLHFKDDDNLDRSHRSHVIAPDEKSDASNCHNRLSSLFAAEEREDSSAENRSNLVSGSPHISTEIKDEARFLKACGTIPETPAEIRKAGEKLRRSPPNETHSDTPKFHSWTPNTSFRTLHTDKQPASPCKMHIGYQQKCSSNFTDGVAPQDLSLVAEVIDEENFSTRTPFTSWPAGSSTRGESKSVHFDCDVNASPHNKSLPGDAMKELTGTGSVMKILPPPTPLQLSDEMPTPGTVYPANMDNAQKGKAIIRSQYVHSVPNPSPDASQLNNTKEEKAHHNQLSNEKEATFEATLSSWLKPPTDNGRNCQPAFRRTYGDRPILGLVATHWNEEEQSQITPKWWDGNGIPNSTSKYREDQKISWHAIPFEERLEKALSEESSFGNRSRVSGSPMSTTLDNDGDSTISRLRSSPHEKTLVSC